MNTDASILVYKFRPEKTGFIMCAEYTQLQLTFPALLPWSLWSGAGVFKNLSNFFNRIDGSGGSGGG